jgi:hypothetical protein
MIYLTKGQTNSIILTLKEKQTLASPNYLFVFTHRGSNIVRSFVLLQAANISAHKERYDEFSIVTNTYFATYDSGEWEYEIYEQTSSTNTDPTLATSKIETGIMRLNDATSFAYTKYQPNNTFIVR